jgi:hypothetical protein
MLYFHARPSSLRRIEAEREGFEPAQKSTRKPQFLPKADFGRDHSACGIDAFLQDKRYRGYLNLMRSRSTDQ